MTTHPHTAAPGGQTMSDWQPIETAPKDGTPFLTFSRDAADRPTQGALGYHSTPFMVMGWLPGDPEPTPVNEHGDWDGWHCYIPTHWMPLPAAPESQSDV